MIELQADLDLQAIDYPDVVTDPEGFWDAHAKRRSHHLAQYLEYLQTCRDEEITKTYRGLVDSAAASLLMSLDLRDAARYERRCGDGNETLRQMFPEEPKQAAVEA